MRRAKLTRYEKEIEKNIDQYVDASQNENERIARLIAAHRKDAVLNIRINSVDLQCLKNKAKKLGVKYQTFISQILHRVAQN